MSTTQTPRSRRSLPDHLDQMLLATEGSLRSHKPSEHGLLWTSGPGAFDVTVSRSNMGRALSIVRAFLKLLHREGCDVRVGEDHKRPTFVAVDGEEIQVRLREGWRQLRLEPTQEEREKLRRGLITYIYRRWEYTPANVINLEIMSYHGHGIRKKWAEGSRGLLVKRLPHVLATLREIAAKEKADRERHYREEIEREERRRRAEEERKRQEEEQRRINNLKQLATNWREGDQIRGFLTAVRENLPAECQVIQDGSPLDEWLKWAEGVADRLDPVPVAFTELSPRRGDEMVTGSA